MKPIHATLIAGLCAAGVITGFAARRIATGRDAGPDSGPPLADGGGMASDGMDSGPSSRRAKPALPELPVLRSTDTVESILRADPETEYGRIALWMTTAGEADLSAYWTGYKDGKRSVPVTDLVFLNWTRRNPQAAPAAVAGTDDERYAWWSWAGNDPEAALAAAKGGDRERLVQVACGIGDFHPAWLKKHLDQIPEEFRSEALSRMRNWSAGQDPLAALEFLKANKAGSDEALFKNLLRQDPWSALDWIRAQNLRDSSDPFGPHGASMEVLITTLSRESPEVLERMAGQAPPGAERRRMEDALFERLLEADPDKALELARNTEAPLMAAQQFGKAGLKLLESDPEQATAIAREILAANPDKLNVENRVDYPGGATASVGVGEATELMKALFARDRAQTLDLMTAPADETGSPSQTFQHFATEWAGQDLNGFAEWIGDQADPKIVDQSKLLVGNQLAREGDFLESIEWLRSMSSGLHQNLIGTLFQWRRADPAAAAEWLDRSDLPPADKARYQEFFNQVDK